MKYYKREVEGEITHYICDNTDFSRNKEWSVCDQKEYEECSWKEWSILGVNNQKILVKNK